MGRRVLHKKGNMVGENKHQYIVEVPAEFNIQAKHPFPYPEDNYNVFEEYFHINFNEQDFRKERKYLPIYWTGYYVRADYGRDTKRLSALQNFINSLPKDEKYYSIVQYDDSIISDLSNIDIKVFSMSPKTNEYPLPLICPLHQFKFACSKDLKTNFIGKITHPIRNKMIETISADKRIVKDGNWYIETRKHSLKDFCQILSRSIFTLCPRGYGPNSFRIMESLQYGSIPVVISDDNCCPHNIPFDDYALIVNSNELHSLYEIINSIDRYTIEEKRYKGDLVFKEYFTYESNKNIILKNLS